MHAPVFKKSSSNIKGNMLVLSPRTQSSQYKSGKVSTKQPYVLRNLQLIYH